MGFGYRAKYIKETILKLAKLPPNYLIELETLQHVYQYDTQMEVFQIDIIHENLFYYRTLKHLVLFLLSSK